MKSCVGCCHANWKKTAAGKLHPSGDGRCGYVYKVPQLPASMYFINGEPKPAGGLINRREELNDHCPYFNREAQ